MAYASKSEQRIAGSTNYQGSVSTLTGDSYRKAGSMSKSPDDLCGKISSGSPGKKMYGSFVSAETKTGIGGSMTASGFSGGPRQHRLSEAANRSQAGNTTRMTPGKGDKSPVMKVTSKTPKELRGGRGR
jgi:hypothetical protein